MLLSFLIVIERLCCSLLGMWQRYANVGWSWGGAGLADTHPGTLTAEVAVYE